MSAKRTNQPNGANRRQPLGHRGRFGEAGITAPTAALAHLERSGGAGVESVVAVDFGNRMTDGVLKQQC